MRRRSRGRPAQLVCEAVAEVEPMCVARSVALAIEPSGAPERAWLEAEPTVEALRSLLDEALDASPGHGTIRVAIHEEQGSVVFRVRHDATPAAAQAHRDDAEEASEESDEPSEGEIVARLIDRIGGELRRAEEEGGRVATLRLPAQERQAEQEEEGSSDRDSSPWVFPVPTAA